MASIGSKLGKLPKSEIVKGIWIVQIGVQEAFGHLAHVSTVFLDHRALFLHALIHAEYVLVLQGLIGQVEVTRVFRLV